jgi:PHD/YefM family antitoxin component YafN of YafNO toxin-antitoxin module
MTSIEIGESLDQLGDLLSRSEAPTEPVLLTKHGVAYAAIVPVNDAGADTESEATWKSPRFQELLARSRADSGAGREQSLEDVARELGLVASAGAE